MSELKQGIILSCIGGRYAVLSDGMRYSCYAKGAFRHAGLKPLTGDFVTFVPGACFPDDGTPLPPSSQGDGYLTSIGDRKTVLSRPPIANVDTLLIFVAAADPAPDLVYVDRLTVCARQKNITPVIVVNKRDLAMQSAETIRRTYTAAGFVCHVMSANSAEEIDRCFFTNLLRGRIAAMAGFSGVGKTSFFNRLFPHECGEVGDLSQKLSRGKNTTRSTELHSLRRSTLKIDGLFADTAGFSRLELDGIHTVQPDELACLFPEFAEHLGTCRFTKCTHRVELGCAIREAVQQGSVNPSRYDSFLALREEILNKK